MEIFIDSANLEEIKSWMDQGVTVTPHTEAFQAVIWHLLVSHPALQIAPTKWESVR